MSFRLRVTELKRAVDQMNWMLRTEKSEQSPFDNGVSAEISGICLDDNDEIGEVVKVVRQLGYDLSDEDNAKVFEAFKRVAAKKHFVGTRELFYPDDTLLYEKLKDNPRVKLYVGQGQNHVYPVYPTLEGRMATETIADIVRR